MDKEIIEGNRLIAEHTGWKFAKGKTKRKDEWYADGVSWAGTEPPFFHSHWELQIPAWSKVAHACQNVASEEEKGEEYLKLLDKYEEAIFVNNREKGQKVIVTAIQWLKANTQTKNS